LIVAYLAARHGFRLLDFDAVRSGARAVLHGRSPYPAPTRHAVLPSTHLVYPPLVAYLFVPFALLPSGVAGAVYFAGSAAAVLAALAVLDVRDHRCYAIVFAGYPVVYSLGFGTLGPPLTLAIALAWRWRDRPLRVAPLLALAVVAKLFLWPLVLWLAATRRRYAAGLTAAIAAVLFVAPFAPLGWSTLRGYPKLLHVLDAVFGPAAYSVQVVVHDLGASGPVATALVVAVGSCLCGVVIWLGLRGDDRRSLTVALVAAISLSPISWLHYYELLLVPLALARPRFSPLWLLPLAYWPLASDVAARDERRLVIALALTALLTARCLDFRIGRGDPAPSGGAANREPERIQAWTS
jgi:hypothetical protein